MNPSTGDNFHTSIAPWLTVSQDTKAIDFYKSAFAATEVYRYDSPTGGCVVRLSVQSAEFWVSEETEKAHERASRPLGGDSLRIILTVPDPDALFARALAAGAKDAERPLVVTAHAPGRIRSMSDVEIFHSLTWRAGVLNFC